MPPRPQTEQEAAATIEAMAAMAQGGGAPQQQAPAGPAKEKETTQGQAQSDGSPVTEGDKMAQDAASFFKIPINGQEREFTQQQLEGIVGRYAAMNYEHAQMKPVLEVVKAYLGSNPNMTPKEVANRLLDLARANQKNPQMGAEAERRQDTQARSAPLDRESLAKWAEENAVSLPPGYEEMMANSQRMQQGMGQMMQMMRAMMAQSQGNVQAAAMANRGVQNDRSQIIQQQIGMNLDRVQQHLGLPDNTANDFLMFSAERGYTLEDFVDPQITLKVMTDFKNAVSSPEMERIRQIAQRRQAFTASGLGSSPGGGAAPAAAESPLEQMTQQVMAKKMGV